MRKGFTLVEILAMIVIIGIIGTIVVSISFSSSERAKEKITEIEEKNLIEAGKMLALDLDDDSSDVYNCTGWLASYVRTYSCSNTTTTCCQKTNNKWVSLQITANDLKTHDYFTDKSNHTSGKVITISSNYEVTINQ